MIKSELPPSATVVVAHPTLQFEPTKEVDTFRNYEDSHLQDSVSRAYRNSHTKQTYEYAKSKLDQYGSLSTGINMSVWEAAELLNTIVDESDPDSDIPQINHLLQTAEAIRKVYPGEEYDWFHLTGFIHDLGKILLNPRFNEPQWAVVGDTFPVGCRFDESNIFYEYFKDNPDYNNSLYNTECGVYEKHCGLENVVMSWGHDEYFYQITNEQDQEMLEWVKKFNMFDLYSKDAEPVNVEKLKPYYQSLIKKYFPDTLRW
ncbi:inositol oxygenase [Heterostelium album PN500]|uniref:Inositol oxygenase n=1 Tax=Heterostelium pallidum (strain ATCC 26659 / Pp 5 / PN500) TaxID=670386 RepID=D3BIR3_HETP5|nr:inositol oxygenase [Heterostelium album PN500]EFA78687.1 inositol oxygenase [Heterostelium album PN500]|eukprot:XP_020430811.1 inositol oxygenase [Heterostelium album PN500]